MLSTRILAIDPGSRVTGFGVVDVLNGKTTDVTSGCIRLPDEVLSVRLKHIFNHVSDLLKA